MIKVVSDKEREKIINYIKNYHLECGKAPSMKNILLGCNTNPRVFYELFKDKEEAFNIAGIPYNDDARKKVEKANIARKKVRSVLIEKQPPQRLRIINKKYLQDKHDEKYVKKLDLMMWRLNNSYTTHLQLNRNDSVYLKEAYIGLSTLIAFWYRFLSIHEDAYIQAQSLRNTMNQDRVLLVEMGFNFNDLEGSSKEICEKKFNELVKRIDSFHDIKCKSYYYLMLNEVFGTPPDLTC